MYLQSFENNSEILRLTDLTILNKLGDTCITTNGWYVIFDEILTGLNTLVQAMDFSPRL